MLGGVEFEYRIKEEQRRENKTNETHSSTRVTKRLEGLQEDGIKDVEGNGQQITG